MSAARFDLVKSFAIQNGGDYLLSLQFFDSSNVAVNVVGPLEFKLFNSPSGRGTPVYSVNLTLSTNTAELLIPESAVNALILRRCSYSIAQATVPILGGYCDIITLGTGEAQSTAPLRVTQNTNVIRITATNVITSNDLSEKADTTAVAAAIADAVRIIDAKPSCKVAAAENINLSALAPLSYDNFTVAVGARVFLHLQTAPIENGTYTINTFPFAPNRRLVRSSDEFTHRATVEIEYGLTYEGRKFILSADDPITIGTTPLIWELLPSAGGVTAYSALTGLPTLGTATALNVAASGNAAAGEVVKGNDTRLAAGGGMAIGGAVTGGTAGSIPFIGTGAVLAQSSGLGFDLSSRVTSLPGPLVINNATASNTFEPLFDMYNVGAYTSGLRISSGANNARGVALQMLENGGEVSTIKTGPGKLEINHNGNGIIEFLTYSQLVMRIAYPLSTEFFGPVTAPEFKIIPEPVGTLPTPTAGRIKFANDLTVTTKDTVAVGGGSNKRMVQADGTNWLIV